MGTRLKWILRFIFLFAILFGSGAAFLISPSGREWRRNRIVRDYEALPESSRRGSSLANDYLALGSIQLPLPTQGDEWFGETSEKNSPHGPTPSETAEMELYKEFCGYKYNGRNGDEFMLKLFSGAELRGLCAADGATGWGPLHPRAPEAYFKYLMIYYKTHSYQNFRGEVANYYRLFFTWCKKFGPTHSVHPNFMKYWPRLRDLSEISNCLWPMDINPTAAGAPTYDPNTDPWTE